ncbi:glycosyltransferase [Prevotella sp. E9-3]|uniref:glycosyltransferase family 2 protein n=1 Tax=Prevotella sp. E9-3 TaxID=2913621 RepID=UPI001EDB3D70|nr:glycosyltransferase family 2 protein [Prevotella sp. E9-3]UKK47497.1 glycosyltransferase [Prevotella sp. E9-3]
MKITVVTVTYNCEKEVEKTIQSVLSQTYPDIEYIIVDGASKDGTLDVVNKYKDRITTIVSEPDRGVYDAMNKAAKLATGEWVNYMNAGDTFVDCDTIRKLFDIDLEGVGVLFGDTISVCTNGESIRIYNPNFWKHKIMPACHQSIFVRADVLKKTPFNLDFKVCADCESFVRMRKEGIKFKYNHVVVARYDATNSGISRNTNTYMKEILSLRYENPIVYRGALYKYELRCLLSQVARFFKRM